MLLKEAVLSIVILKIEAGGTNQIWYEAKVRGAGIKRVQPLVGSYTEQLRRYGEYLKEKVKEAPNVEKMLAISGSGMSTAIGFIAGGYRTFH